jgi:predicted nucleic acid-binding Zn ribbon protein
MEHSSTKKSKAEPVGKVLGVLLEELGLGKKLKQYEAVRVWREVVGERIAGAAIPTKIINGTLIVKVEKSTWRNELSLLKREIIAKINSALKEDIVKDIKFS